MNGSTKRGLVVAPLGSEPTRSHAMPPTPQVPQSVIRVFFASCD